MPARAHVTSANCLLLGGPGSGKSSLLYSYDRGTFPNTSLPAELVVERRVTKRNKTLNLRLADLGDPLLFTV